VRNADIVDSRGACPGSGYGRDRCPAQRRGGFLGTRPLRRGIDDESLTSSVEWSVISRAVTLLVERTGTPQAWESR
jgi:hypothetical protein